MIRRRPEDVPFRSPRELNLDKVNVDFSFVHILDHRVWEKRCTELPGGRRRHLWAKWRFVWREELRTQTVCRLGLHTPTQVTSYDQDRKPHSVHVRCQDCWKPLSAEQPI